MRTRPPVGSLRSGIASRRSCVRKLLDQHRGGGASGRPPPRPCVAAQRSGVRVGKKAEPVNAQLDQANRLLGVCELALGTVRAKHVQFSAIRICAPLFGGVFFVARLAPALHAYELILTSNLSSKGRGGSPGHPGGRLGRSGLELPCKMARLAGEVCTEGCTLIDMHSQLAGSGPRESSTAAGANRYGCACRATTIRGFKSRPAADSRQGA
jgi:hypothetical protein